MSLRRRVHVLGWVFLLWGCEPTPNPDPAQVEQCASYCTTCSVGPCIGGGSGHCEGPDGMGRRECILASAGDCDAVQRCLAETRDM